MLLAAARLRREPRCCENHQSFSVPQAFCFLTRRKRRRNVKEKREKRMMEGRRKNGSSAWQPCVGSCFIHAKFFSPLFFSFSSLFFTLLFIPLPLLCFLFLFPRPHPSCWLCVFWHWWHLRPWPAPRRHGWWPQRRLSTRWSCRIRTLLSSSLSTTSARGRETREKKNENILRRKRGRQLHFHPLMFTLLVFPSFFFFFLFFFLFGGDSSGLHPRCSCRTTMWLT